jgi:hypothetical protein
MQIPLIDLDRIAAERAGVVTLNGVQHMVKPISAATLQLMRNAQPDNYLDISMTVVERCVPSIGAEDRQELIPAQLEAIVAVANGDVDAVAKLDPNVERPTTPPDSSV